MYWGVKMNDLQDGQAKSDSNKKLEQIRNLAGLLSHPESIEQHIRKIAWEEKSLFRKLCLTPISAGHFYELDIIEHSHFVIFLSALVSASTQGTELPDEMKEFLDEEKDNFPDWLDIDSDENLQANLFGGFYTLNKSIKAINAVGKSINQLLDEGSSKNDRSRLKMAVKLDPVAITSPQVSSMLMLAETLNKKDFRNDLHNALKKPYLKGFVAFAKLRFIVWALRKEGLLQDMSEIERYQFLHNELNLYKDNEDGEDHQDSLNRMIRRWEAEYRT
jgi:hypothetical protein